MVGTHRCPRCGGNLLFSREEGYSEWRCLQCGRAYSQHTEVSPVPAPIRFSGVHCAECSAPIPVAANARRRYCSDRCRMRAARRRWSDRGDQVAV